MSLFNEKYLEAGKEIDCVPGLIALGVIVSIVIACYSLVSKGDRDTAVVMESEYCEMVDLYNSSQGQQGWPDFKHKYEDMCD